MRNGNVQPAPENARLALRNAVCLGSDILRLPPEGEALSFGSKVLICDPPHEMKRS